MVAAQSIAISSETPTFTLPKRVRYERFTIEKRVWLTRFSMVKRVDLTRFSKIYCGLNLSTEI